MYITLQGGPVKKEKPVTTPPPEKPEKAGGDVAKEPPGYKMAQVFINSTFTKICDMIIEVSGDPSLSHGPPGPTIMLVDGTELDTSDSDLGQEKPNSTRVHIRFTHCVDNERKFKLNILFNRAFNSGESVTYTPTDQEGAAIA